MPSSTWLIWPPRPASRDARSSHPHAADRLSKAEIVRLGAGTDLHFGLTHSCYDPDASGRPCGACDSCMLRAQGFREVASADRPHEDSRNLLFGAGRGQAGRRALRFRAHQRLQPALLLVRYPLHFMASRGDELGSAKFWTRWRRFPAARHVVVTGGEPMIAPAFRHCRNGLRERGMHITVETAGTVFTPVACDLMSISPKLSNSTPEGSLGGQHETPAPAAGRPAAPDAGYDYQLKFVIARGRHRRSAGAGLAA